MLKVQNVSKFFGQRCILKDVSLHVPAGSIFLLMGANGAGKSTLLRIMAGLSKPSLGTIHYAVDEGQRGYLGHSTFLYPALTAWENLLFWAQMYDLPLSDHAGSLQERIKEVLERVELRNFAHEKAGIFSRGMSQRLNLARVLLLKPSLWLLDEPSTGLDTSSVALLRREVLRAKEEGAGIVWISHDKEGDTPLADCIMSIKNMRLCTEQAYV